MSNDENPIRLPLAAAELDQPAILGQWASILPASSRLLGASLFGDLFVVTETTGILMLDVVSGELKQVAEMIEEFEWKMTQPEWREEHFMKGLANAAIASGIMLQRGECYAFRTPPTLGGTFEVSNLVPWNLLAYHTGLAKLWPQL